MEENKSTLKTEIRKKYNELLSLFESNPDRKQCNDAVTALICKLETLGRLEEPNSEGFANTVMLKAYALFKKLLINLLAVDGEQTIKETEEIYKLMFPYKDQPVGLYMFLIVSGAMSTNYLVIEDTDKARKIAREADETYERYFKTHTEEPMNFKDLIDIPEISGLSPEHFRCLVADIVFQSHRRTLDFDLRPYTVPSIKFIISQLHHPRVPLTIKIRCLETLPSILNVISNSYRFKQMDHTLAVLMHELIKFRRTLPEGSRRLLNYTQGIIAMSYMFCGVSILSISINKLNGKHSPDCPDVDNDSFEPICSMNDANYELYSNQFPVNPMTKKFEMQLALKKAKDWKKRASLLLGGNNLPMFALIASSLADVEAKINTMPN